jgi:2-phosphosulfolactate phosphatase
MGVRVWLTAGEGVVPTDAAALVIDVLRASTTLTVALSSGAARVFPVASVEEALALKAADPCALLCGEREGVKVAGFDLGNSPSEYTPAAVGGRSLIFASTNGSVAMLSARGARRRVLAAFVNATAALKAVASERLIILVCAGKLGSFCLEDAACAGWLCAGLARRGARIEGDPANMALSLAPRDGSEVRALVMGSEHGRYLRCLGSEFARDVELCASLDQCDRAFEF